MKEQQLALFGYMEIIARLVWLQSSENSPKKLRRAVIIFKPAVLASSSGSRLEAIRPKLDAPDNLFRVMAASV